MGHVCRDQKQKRHLSLMRKILFVERDPANLTTIFVWETPLRQNIQSFWNLPRIFEVNAFVSFVLHQSQQRCFDLFGTNATFPFVVTARISRIDNSKQVNETLLSESWFFWQVKDESLGRGGGNSEKKSFWHQKPCSPSSWLGSANNVAESRSLQIFSCTWIPYIKLISCDTPASKQGLS